MAANPIPLTRDRYDAPRPRPRPMRALPLREPSLLPSLAGALTVGAGLVHVTAVRSHREIGTLVALFITAAVVQGVIGLVAALSPGRTALKLVVVVNSVIAAAWTVSRVSGLPGVDGLDAAQSVGVQDALATALELTAATLAAVALLRAVPPRSLGLSPLWALALAPALVGVAAPHDHATHSGSGGHSGAAGTTHPSSGPNHVAGDEHDPGEHAAAGGVANDPIFAGADTSKSTEGQLVSAKSLITVTRNEVSRQFPDKAALVAAGYHSIGDGAPFTQFEHYINETYLNDGLELDPERIESIVVEGNRIVSAMFILDEGKTIDDVPELGGPLTAWHDHQNLCWQDTGYRLAGIVMNGKCFPGGTLRPTPPMLHVWLTEQPCGPFAGIEGHPAAPCSSSHGGH